MNWVTIDHEACNLYVICVSRDRVVFREKDGKITARANEETCNLCGHCVSLCPTGAISHTQMDIINFIEIGEKVRFGTDDFIKFIRQRRSMRRFKDKPIPYADLQILSDVSRYAPTGSNRQAVEIIIITDRDKINRYSNPVVDYFEKTLPVLGENPQGRLCNRRSYSSLDCYDNGLGQLLYRPLCICSQQLPTPCKRSVSAVGK